MRRWIELTLALLFIVAPAPASGEDKFFDSNGVQIRYVEQGGGVPVVLVHGYSNTLDMNWVETGIVADLAKDHRVIAFDMRGHGKSDKPHDRKAYGKQMSQDIVRLMDHLGIKRAHMVGYSLGAGLVGNLLTTHPDRFLSATLCALGLTKDVPEEDEKRATEAERGSFRSLILDIWPSNLSPPTEDMIRQQSQAIIARGNDVLALAQIVRGFPDLAVTPAQAATIRTPTQAIVGSVDPNLVAVRDLKAVLPTLQVTVVEGATHAGNRGVLGRSEFVSALRAFIDSAGKKLAQ